MTDKNDLDTTTEATLVSEPTPVLPITDEVVEPIETTAPEVKEELADDSEPTEEELVDPDFDEQPLADTDFTEEPAIPATEPVSYFDSYFADMDDFGENSRYYHVHFSGLEESGNRAFGSIPIYSNGIFNLEDVKQIIMTNNPYIDVAIAGWQEIKTREEFNAIHGVDAVDDTGECVSYYHVHYVLTDGEGRQVIGSTPAQTAGILNIPALRRFLAETYATNENYVVITNWLPIDTVEDFAKLNGFIINEPTPQQ